MIAWIDASGGGCFLLIETEAAVPTTLYASDGLMLAVSDPAWSVVPVLVGTVTVTTLSVVIWIVAVVGVPKSPTQAYWRSTWVGVVRDIVRVKAMLSPSVTADWSATIDAVRSRVDPVPGSEKSLLPSAFDAWTIAWYSVLTFRPLMMALVMVAVCSAQLFSLAMLYLMA